MSENVYIRPPIVDEIWQILRETAAQSKQHEREFQAIRKEREETRKQRDREFEEIRKQQEETRKQRDREFEETRRMMREMSLEADRRAQELDKKFQETDREIKEMSRELKAHIRASEKRSKELDKKLGELGNRLGEFVEGMIEPSIKRLFATRGINLRTVSRDVSSSSPALHLAMQIDLFAINGDCCVLIEVKSKLSLDDVNEHIERMEKFKPLFPEYADKKAYGAVAAMVIPEDVGKYAYRKGFFVITQQGESAVILNDKKFMPAAW